MFLNNIDLPKQTLFVSSSFQSQGFSHHKVNAMISHMRVEQLVALTRSTLPIGLGDKGLPSLERKRGKVELPVSMSKHFYFLLSYDCWPRQFFSAYFQGDSCPKPKDNPDKENFRAHSCLDHLRRGASPAVRTNSTIPTATVSQPIVTSSLSVVLHGPSWCPGLKNIVHCLPFEVFPSRSTLL